MQHKWLQNKKRGVCAIIFAQFFKKNILSFLIIFLSMTCCALSFAETINRSLDRVEVVQQQIILLKNRADQAKNILIDLQKEDLQVSSVAIEKASKNLLDKATLDITVSKSDLENITIELNDSKQNVLWLEKNTQEIQNQLNIINIFGNKIATSELMSMGTLKADLNFQNKLLNLEKKRLLYLNHLNDTTQSILQIKRDKLNRLKELLRSHRMLFLKQQQARDELIYQIRQNDWLQQVTDLHKKLVTVDPVQNRDNYTDLERQIFHANENASLAYSQSLLARYKDQIQQMKLSIYRGNSVSMLNEMNDQVISLNKQIDRLKFSLTSRIQYLTKHVNDLSVKRKADPRFKDYLAKLTFLNKQYQVTQTSLLKLNQELISFRKTVDQAVQTELSARQGLPSFSPKMLIELGKEILLVPALAFEVVKSLGNQLITAFHVAAWSFKGILLFAELLFISFYFYISRLMQSLVNTHTDWREKINLRWISLQWLHRSFLDIVFMGNFLLLMYVLNIPKQNYLFVSHLFIVWLVFKSVLVVAKVSLIETTLETTSRDKRLYQGLKWLIWVGGVITALTVFAYQLPLIYELKTLCERLFLIFLLVGSLLLLRYADILPNLILAQMNEQHPYLKKSIRLVGVIIPLLLFVNSILGIFGFLNLVLTISWYESVFLLVLIGYLIVRGLLSDIMEFFSTLLIKNISNGWLYTEAFLKPLDTIIRLVLFLSAWLLLFLFYGWDKQSPIAERFSGLLNYQILQVLKTTITPLNILELIVVISIFYWTAKWIREFVYRMLATRTQDMGIRNSIAILSQYSVIILGLFFCLRVLGIDFSALAMVASFFAFGVGLGLRDLANNFACGFLILLERPLRVGDLVSINNIEGEVTHIGGRAVTVKTWDYMELVVPNAEIFNKSFTNWTGRDNIVRTVLHIKISRHDNPHQVKTIIERVILQHNEILEHPAPEVFLKEMSDTLMEFEVRYFVNIRQVPSRIGVMSKVLISIWDAFAEHKIQPPYPQREIVLKRKEVVNLLPKP